MTDLAAMCALVAVSCLLETVRIAKLARPCTDELAFLFLVMLVDVCVVVVGLRGA